MKREQLTSMLDMVKEFNEAFKIPYDKQFCGAIFDNDHLDGELRHNLMQEENDEYFQAIENNDMLEVADACGDMLYILCGTILRHGLQNKIFDIFTEIHRSNMTKLVDGKALRRADGKIIKGENYEAPNISKFV
jgi:predicted HAD superfamily Cof-like phosphohydrolase